jgi:hypothetical protein
MKEIENPILNVINNIRYNNPELIKLVDFDPQIPLLDTVIPGTVINFEIIDSFSAVNLEHKLYAKQLISSAIFWDQINPPVRELIDGFIDEISKKDLDLSYARPLPHINCSTIFYRPVKINNYPARLICSYSLMNQAWYMTLDTIIPSKTWRENKGLL